MPFRLKVITKSVPSVASESVAHVSSPSASRNLTYSSTPQRLSVNTWHRRLNHLNFGDVRRLVPHATGIQLDSSHPCLCESCILGKLTRKQYSSRPRRTTRPLELVHMDVGVVNTKSLRGHLYFVLFVDDFSRECFAHFLQSKDMASDKIDEFIEYVENQTGHRVKELRSDRGGEFLAGTVAGICARRGILNSPSPAHSPSSNGTAERWIRTVMQATRCILIASELPTTFWAEALATAVHVVNRCPTRALEGRTPHEKWTGKQPDVGHLRVFGRLAYALSPSKSVKKLDARSSPFIFVGYDSGTHGYRLYDPVTRRISVRRDVVFDETRLGSCLLSSPRDGQPSGYDLLFPLLSTPFDDGVYADPPTSFHPDTLSTADSDTSDADSSDDTTESSSTSDASTFSSVSNSGSSSTTGPPEPVCDSTSSSNDRLGDHFETEGHDDSLPAPCTTSRRFFTRTHFLYLSARLICFTARSLAR